MMKNGNNNEIYVLEQIDYYGILSPFSIPDYQDSAPKNDEEIVSSEVIHDLEIRAKIHGYPHGVNVERIRTQLETEPIPLRSIRVPIQAGMTLGWAPNGYGKTFIFDQLLSNLKSYIYAKDPIRSFFEYKDELQNHINKGKDDVSNVTNLNPFHCIGLRVKSNDNTSMNFLLMSDTYDNEEDTTRIQIYYNQTTSHAENEIENQEGDWIYRRNQSWESILLNPKSGFNKEAPKSTQLAYMALSMLFNMNVNYIETPKIGSGSDFYRTLVESVQKELFVWSSDWNLQLFTPELESNPLNGIGRVRDYDVRLKDVQQFLSTPYVPEQDEHSLNILGRICDEISFYTDSMAIGHLDFNVKQKDIIKLIDYFEQSLVSTAMNEDNNSLMSQLETLCILQTKINSLLFTRSDYNETARFECFEMLMNSISNASVSLDSPWLEMANEILHIALVQYFDLLYELEEVDELEVQKYLNKAASLDFEYLNYRINLIRLRRNFEAPTIESVVEGFGTFVNEGVFNDLEKVIKNSWPWAIKNSHYCPKSVLKPQMSFFKFPAQEGEKSPYSQAIGLISERSQLTEIRDPENIVSKYIDEISHFEYTGGYGGLRWSFFPRFTAHGANPYLYLMCLNESINPAGGPWAVEVYFNSLFESGEYGNQTLHEHEVSPPIRFHRQGDPNDFVAADHLSFGMRSELILQASLLKFIMQARGEIPLEITPPMFRDATHSAPYNLLILDESEVGRSEYWTNLLIKRFQRFEVQVQHVKNQQALIISHRGLVLEDSMRGAEHVVLHRIPSNVKEEE